VGSLEGRLGGRTADVHDHLALLIESPTAECSDWEEAPKLNVAYGPVIERIKHLMSHGLSVMMVLHDFRLRCIAPLQDCARSVWMYIREGETMWLEHGRDSYLMLDVMGTLLGRLSPDPSSVDFITPSAICTPMCLDQVMRTRLLRELPTLDDIDIIARQGCDES
jgi:hypothetical protein